MSLPHAAADPAADSATQVSDDFASFCDVNFLADGVAQTEELAEEHKQASAAAAAMEADQWLAAAPAKEAVRYYLQVVDRCLHERGQTRKALEVFKKECSSNQQ